MYAKGQRWADKMWAIISAYDKSNTKFQTQQDAASMLTDILTQTNNFWDSIKTPSDYINFSQDLEAMMINGHIHRSEYDKIERIKNLVRGYCYWHVPVLNPEKLNDTSILDSNRDELMKKYFSELENVEKEYEAKIIDMWKIFHIDLAKIHLNWENKLKELEKEYSKDSTIYQQHFIKWEEECWNRRTVFENNINALMAEHERILKQIEATHKSEWDKLQKEEGKFIISPSKDIHIPLDLPMRAQRQWDKLQLLCSTDILGEIYRHEISIENSAVCLSWCVLLPKKTDYVTYEDILKDPKFFLCDFELARMIDFITRIKGQSFDYPVGWNDLYRQQQDVRIDGRRFLEDINNPSNLGIISSIKEIIWFKGSVPIWVDNEGFIIYLDLRNCKFDRDNEDLYTCMNIKPVSLIDNQS